MGKEWQVCLEGAEVFCGVLWQGSHQKGPCWVRKADFYWGGRACLPFMNKIESQSLIVNSWGSIEPFDQQEKNICDVFAMHNWYEQILYKSYVWNLKQVDFYRIWNT